MKAVFVAFFLVVSLGVFAQGGVKLDDKASVAIGNQWVKSKVTGYRICVFSDNSQSARGAASAAMSRLDGSFGLSANVVYQNPFFKVYAGYCINRLEASILLGRLKPVFPSAFIVSEQVPLSVFSRSTSADVAVPVSEGVVE